jgi:Bacteriophage lambda head decoration protein D
MALIETRHAGEFVLSEAAGNRSRDSITIVSGAGIVRAGTVVGKIAVGTATPAAVAGNTGNGTPATVTVGAGAKVGVYRAVCIEPATDFGTFTVEDPDGITVGVATVGSEFVGGGLTFTIADGSTDFVSGDAFTITVAAGSGTYTPAPAATVADGSNAALAVTLYEVDATSAEQTVAAIVRDAEVNANILTYESSVDDATKKGVKHSQLAAVGIIVR